jgi:hypothetical protein
VACASAVSEGADEGNRIRIVGLAAMHMGDWSCARTLQYVTRWRRASISRREMLLTQAATVKEI